MLTFERKARWLPRESGLPDELDNIHVLSPLIKLLDSSAGIVGLCHLLLKRQWN